ncbi:bifunctional 4-hydroxy-2-oxoglutarate aldolase/2-dehydro-3-deoxy-phosphogluconate aldolase [Microbacterium sp. P5_E9]
MRAVPGGGAPADPADVEAAIRAQGGVPVLRAATADLAHTASTRLIEAGLSVIELTATTPNWAQLLHTLVREHPEAVIGMGTITTAEDAALACEAGARFLVSPFPVEDARRIAQQADTLFIGGGFSPGEVAAASRFGVCKLFPAHVGGIGYLKTLRAILPEARIMPTGGIGLSAVGEWLRAGAFAVGVGSDLSNAPDLDAAASELLRQVQLGRSA